MKSSRAIAAGMMALGLMTARADEPARKPAHSNEEWRKILAETESRSESDGELAAKMAAGAEDFAAQLRAAVRVQAEAGELGNFEEERVGDFSGMLLSLDWENFLAAVKPMAGDEWAPAALRADAVAKLIGAWGGAHDSEGRSPAAEQVEIAEALMPLFPKTVQQAVVAYPALKRTSMEDPERVMPWLKKHSGLWKGEAREALAEDLLGGWGMMNGHLPTLADVQDLEMTDYRFAGRMLGKQDPPPKSVVRMRKLMGQAGSKERAEELHQGMLEGMGRNLPRMKYEEFRKWLAEESGLSAEEVKTMASGVNLDLVYVNGRPSELNQWIAWLKTELPGEVVSAKLEAQGERLQAMPWALEEIAGITQSDSRAALVRGFSRKEQDPQRLKDAQALLAK